MKDVVLPVAVPIALAILIRGVIAKPYQIPTESMVPTIQAGDRVIANRVIYKFRDIDRGDFIVFEPTLEARKSCAQTAEEIASNIPFVPLPNRARRSFHRPSSPSERHPHP